MGDTRAVRLMESVEAMVEAHAQLSYVGKCVNASDLALARDEVYDELEEFVEAVSNAIHEAIEAMSWRPIETAPTDGTLFLAWGPEKNQQDPAVVRAEMVPHRNGPYIQCSRPGTYDDGCLYFTHWMPIPEAPR